MLSNAFGDLIAARLDALVRHGLLTVKTDDGRELQFGDGDPNYPRATITPPRFGAFVLSLLFPDPFFLEGYVRRRWDLRDGEIEDLLLLLVRNVNRMPKSFGRKMLDGVLYLRFLVRQYAGVKLDRRFVSHHYDIGNDLYSRFLDPEYMQYSCAFFEPGDDLRAAQQRKMDLTLERLDVGDAGRVLDIGCGWGGLTRRIAELNQSAEIVGVTLSHNQQAHAEKMRLEAPDDKAKRLRYLLEDYREHKPAHAYDRIVSVGMFEHVGLFQYGAFFDALRRLLAPGGRALLHTIVRPAPGHCSVWIDRHIFPGGYIPAVSEVLKKIEKRGLRVEAMHCHAGENYQRTLCAWRENYRARRAELPDKYDERFHRMWEMYFGACIQVFDALGDGNQVVQFVLHK